jgi:hypothetical protein
MFSVAVPLPAVAPVKVTNKPQLAPAATVEPQFVDSLNSLALAPVIETLRMFSGAAPVFDKVTPC